MNVIKHSTIGEHMRDIAATTIVTVPTINEITNDGIITAFQLDNVVLWGLTYGAWFKVGMFVALGLLIVERTVSIRNKLKINIKEAV